MARVLSAALVGYFVLFAAIQNSKAAESANKNSEKSTASNNEHCIKATPAVELSGKEKRLVKAVNAYREKKGLDPLTVDPKLMKVARNAAPYFSHCINGKWCWHRAHEVGFAGWATDDIADGYETPEDAVDGWATSDGHARQMRGYFNMNGQWCNYRFNRIGVGICGRKYIAVFGRCDDQPRGDSKSEGKERS
jgi:uncharacterized protein YkwD